MHYNRICKKGILVYMILRKKKAICSVNILNNLNLKGHIEVSWKQKKRKNILESLILICKDS